MNQVTAAKSMKRFLAFPRTIASLLLVISILGLVRAQQITNTSPPMVQTPATVGKLPKWSGVSGGKGILGDSLITETPGNITVAGAFTATGPINTNAQYNIAGNRVLSAVSSNLFAGFGAGANTTGGGNSFFGFQTGFSNTSSPGNSFFGYQAGYSSTGNGNSFFGLQAGYANTSNLNSFFGSGTGIANTTGAGNSFFGALAGSSNTTAGFNSFFGSAAGTRNTTGISNAFFGYAAGQNNNTGANNVFFGFNSGLSNTAESGNTFIGASSNGAAGITNATSLGANAVVTQSNSLVLGNNANVGIGTSAPQAKLHVIGTTAGRFDGNVSINGNLTVTGSANLTAANAIHATAADTATNFTGSLAGDVTGPQNATVVTSVGGRNAASISAATDAFNAATSSNTPGTIVKRDPSGNFGAGVITASLNGNAATATTANTANTLASSATVSGAQISGDLANATIAGNKVTSAVANSDHASTADTTRGLISAVQDSDIVSPGPGQVYFNTTSHVIREYDGSSWKTMDAGLAVQLSSIGTLNAGANPVDWTQLKNVPSNVAAGYSAGSGISINGSNAISNTGVLSVGATGPLSSSGGQNPNLSLTGVVPVANGGTGSSTQNFVDLTNTQTIGGAKTFTNPIAGNINGNAATVTNGVYISSSYANPAWITSLDGNKITAGTVVKTINGLTDNVSLVAGSNITIAPSGNSLTISSATTAAGARQLNHLQIATLRWYEANRSLPDISVGNGAGALTFDGANVWVAVRTTNSVAKIRANDGVILATYPAGVGPVGVAFDGANIWVTNYDSTTVTKLQGSDGSILGTFPVGSTPYHLAFDGDNVWVANSGSNTATKLRASDGASLGTYAVGTNPYQPAFDGTSIWVSNQTSNTVTKLRPSDGAVLGTYAVGMHPRGLAFDGENLWVANAADNTVSKLSKDGVTLGTFAVSPDPYQLAFDGENIWVASAGTVNGSVTKLRASDGALVGSFTTGMATNGVAFDGVKMWLSNYNDGTVSRR